MIDPSVSLAFAVHSHKGGYALLLGSGLSRSAGIPTGWEVVNDLIRNLAAVEGGDCGAEPAAWFKSQYGADPDYSVILDKIAHTQAERQQLLRAYFEPNEEERSQGLKTPTPGHKAIASLAASGHLRVIVTTNFDRLTEQALDAAGVSATVISSADHVAGALPLAHSGVTLIKVHGDYLDIRIKNTMEELGTYEGPIDALLDRVFDEYGLIVCGWSGEWDAALRSAMLRCPSRRFTTFWTKRSELSAAAADVAQHRRAALIDIVDANTFFESLASKVRTLAELAAPHPLSAKIAAAMVKKFVIDSAVRIKLHDLLHDETERLLPELSVAKFPTSEELDPATALVDRIKRYESLTEIVRSMLIVGGYWGTPENSHLWIRCLKRVASAGNSAGGYDYLNKLRLYPALLAFYSLGIPALAAGNYSLLAEMFAAKVRHNSEEKFLAQLVPPFFLIEQGMGRLLPGMERHHTPTNDLVHAFLRAPLKEILPDATDYDVIFDRFEYLIGLVQAAREKNDYAGNDSWWGPLGRFGWRRDSAHSARKLIREELEKEKGNWGPIKAGMFEASHEVATEAVTKFNKFLAQVPFR